MKDAWECREPGCVSVRHVDPVKRVSYAVHVHPSHDELGGFDLGATLEDAGDALAEAIEEANT